MIKGTLDDVEYLVDGNLVKLSLLVSEQVQAN